MKGSSYTVTELINKLFNNINHRIDRYHNILLLRGSLGIKKLGLLDYFKDITHSRIIWVDNFIK